ncbi:MAG: T9SS type A sorting domain-containing protein, partial [Desulfobacterales bacterium]|nr:T9SS type A sorting domain-containing protein [Desulfobacterales bacterium]
IAGNSITNLLNAPNYPNSPSVSAEMLLFEIPSDQGDNFGARVSGYLCAPETGTYYFWIAGNNHTELNLSTTNLEADKVRIAHHEDWAGYRQWDKFPTQKSQGVVLTQGVEYYIEAFLKESSGGDKMAVGWRRPSDGDGALPTEVIPGNVLSPISSGGVTLKINEPDIELSLYPNPAGDMVGIKISKNTDTDFDMLHIFDAQGKRIKSMRAKDAWLQEEQYQMEVSELPSGMYIMRIDRRAKTPKILKFFKE